MTQWVKENLYRIFRTGSDSKILEIK